MERMYRILSDDLAFRLHCDRRRHSTSGLFGGGHGRRERRAGEHIKRDAREGCQARGAPVSPADENL